MLSDRSPLRLLTVMRHHALVLNYRVRLLWRGRNVTRRESVPYLFRIFGMRFAEAAPHEAARRGIEWLREPCRRPRQMPRFCALSTPAARSRDRNQ